MTAFIGITFLIIFLFATYMGVRGALASPQRKLLEQGSRGWVIKQRGLSTGKISIQLEKRGETSQRVQLLDVSSPTFDDELASAYLEAERRCAMLNRVGDELA